MVSSELTVWKCNPFCEVIPNSGVKRQKRSQCIEEKTGLLEGTNPKAKEKSSEEGEPVAGRGWPVVRRGGEGTWVLPKSYCITW